MPDYDRGDTARLSLLVKDAAGALVDPATLTLTVRTPAGVDTTTTSPAAPIVHDSTGTYHADVALPEAGIYTYQWETTVPGQVQGGTLDVDPAPLDAAATSARGLLAHMTSADTEPVLSDADLDLLLELARIPDSVGLAATDAGWTPTYDLNYAAAEGWRWKAGKAAASYAFSMDGESPERSFLMVRCEHMADRYSRKVVTSVPVSTGRSLPSYIPLI
jgi:hypothetical protein